MKSRYLFFSPLLTIAVASLMYGAGLPQDSTKIVLKQHDPSSMMGKPTADATVDGLHIQVWVVTQDQHKEIMKDRVAAKDSNLIISEEMPGMKRDHSAMVDSMTAGTHDIMLKLTDAKTGVQIGNATATIAIESPSKKDSSVDLKAMMGHYGTALTLVEKGDYQFTLSATTGGAAKTTKFNFAVK